MRIIDISRPLDETTAVFPGDVPFSRSVTMSMERGDVCNVTCLTASAHAGTHIDQPHHYKDGAPDHPLEVFIGPANVIEIDDWDRLAGLTISPGRRVLFKTRNSLSDFSKFDPSFTYPPGTAIEWLVRMGAVLIGVDGPSVDAAESKTLPNHLRLCEAGIAILENLDLRDAPEGEYELVALPIRIPNTDATWVRAILREFVRS